MLVFVAAAMGGLVVLVWGADRFVIGAASTARHLGVSPLLIGLTVVGFGTSAPEMLVSGIAAWQGNPGLGIGNALGSNIANIALILGTTALVIPLAVRSETLRREYPVLVLVSLLSLGLMWDGSLDRTDGVVLLTGLFTLLAWVVYIGLRSRSGDPLATEFEGEIPTNLTLGASLGWLAIGLILLLASSRVLVWGAVGIAQTLGISDLVIGLTVVAIGTSLPELAAGIASARKGEHDIAVGNIIGSNMFNLLAVLALPGLIHPGPFEPEVLTRDFPVMIGLTLAMLVMATGTRGTGRINRVEGAILLMAFAGYQMLLYFTQIP